MAEQLLYGSDIVAALDQVRGEAVPEGVATARLSDPCLLDGVSHCVLETIGNT
jgi:hypothetical protein